MALLSHTLYRRIRTGIASHLKKTSSRPTASSTNSSRSQESLDVPTNDGGGYYPAKFGETLKERYTIVGELGWGQYSSVWLAKDLITESHVALKLLTLNATHGAMVGKIDEVKLLRKVTTALPAHPGHAHVLGVLDHFMHPGVRGDHICIIHEVMGPTLLTVIKQSDAERLSLPMVKSISKQILLALAYLHDECGIIHCDLKPSNILLAIADLENIIRSELSIKSHSLVESQCLSMKFLSDPLYVRRTPLQIKLADFGHSNWRENHLTEFIQPKCLRAPEVILGADWDTSADIWNLGCLVFELLTGQVLFKNTHDKRWSFEDEHLMRIRLLFGEDLPDDLRLRGRRSTKFFDKSGRFKILGDAPDTWPDPALDTVLRVTLQDFIEEDEVQAFAHFLRRMLRPRPQDRAHAVDLLDDNWLRCV